MRIYSIENRSSHGETNGMFLADAASYGADKLWCLLKPIPIELDGDSSACEDAEAGDSEPAAKRARGNEAVSS